MFAVGFLFDKIEGTVVSPFWGDLQQFLVVKPVFKEENANTFGAILLRLMQADCESKS